MNLNEIEPEPLDGKDIFSEENMPEKLEAHPKDYQMFPGHDVAKAISYLLSDPHAWDHLCNHCADRWVALKQEDTCPNCDSDDIFHSGLFGEGTVKKSFPDLTEVDTSE